MIAAGKKEFRTANENYNCLAEDSSASPDPVNISHAVVSLWHRRVNMGGLFSLLPQDHLA